MKVKFAFTFLAFFIAILSIAQNKSSLHPNDTLTIEYIGVKNNAVKSIVIAGQLKYVGSNYIAKDQVIWTSDIEMIRVMNHRTKESLNLQNPSSPVSKKSRFYSAYIKRSRTGTKGAGTEEAIKSMKEFLSQAFYMLDDELLIGSSLVVDNQHTYVLKPKDMPKAKSIRLKYNPDEPYVMYIPKQQLLENNIDIANKPCVFQINYIGGGNNIFITDEFSIGILK